MRFLFKITVVALQLSALNKFCEGTKQDPMAAAVAQQAKSIEQLHQQVSALKGQIKNGAAASSTESVHLSIKYPGMDESETPSTIGTVAEAIPQKPAPTKTPLIIIAPKPLMSFNNLYEKMVKEASIMGSDANSLLKNQDVALSNPLERIKVLRKDQEQAAQMEAFYKADEAETTYATKNYPPGIKGRAKSFYKDLMH